MSEGQSSSGGTVYPKVEMETPAVSEPGESSKAGEARDGAGQGEPSAAAAEAGQQVRYGVLVADLDPKATEQVLREFFQFSGKITGIELFMQPEGGHAARIYFEKEEEAETAVLLTGAIIMDRHVVISSLFDGSPPPVMGKKAVDVISAMLAHGFVLGKSTLDRLSDFDKKVGLSEKVKANVAKAKTKLAEFDAKYQVGAKAKGLFNSFQEKMQLADGKFKISERFNTTSKKVSENQSVQKVKNSFKFGFSTISTNVSKVSNATSTKIKGALGSKDPAPAAT